MDKFRDDVHEVIGPGLDDFEAGNCLGLGRA